MVSLGEERERGQHTVLAGRYQLISPLGRGGMGQFWEGKDLRLERRVAVKFLTNEVSGRSRRTSKCEFAASAPPDWTSPRLGSGRPVRRADVP